MGKLQPNEHRYPADEFQDRSRRPKHKKKDNANESASASITLHV